MRAAVLREHGAAPVAGERPEPAHDASVSAGRTLVRVSAAPITPLDVLCASGTSYFGPPALPYVPGVQGVGRVVAGSLPPGTRVWFPTTAGMAPGDGAMAELVTVADGDLVPLTDEVDDAALAALGLSAIAAWTALLDRAALQPGERVLVLGSSGVVGSVAVRAAVLRGAGAVFAAALEPASEAVARAGGASGFVPLGGLDGLDGLPGDEAVRVLQARMAEVVGEVDVVLDPLCGVPSSAAARCLAPGGRLVNLGSSAGPTASYDSAHLRSGSRSILGYTNNDLTPERRARAMAEIQQHAAAGELAVPHKVYALDQVSEAWAAHCSGAARGRVVVRV